MIFLASLIVMLLFLRFLFRGCLARLVPIWTLALRTNTRLGFDFTGNPFVFASLALESPNCNFYFHKHIIYSESIFLSTILFRLTAVYPPSNIRATENEQKERQERGLLIAARTRITQAGKLWRVPSASNYAPFYEVDPNPEAPRCTCPDFEKRRERCKHIYAVEIVIERESSISTVIDGDLTTVTTTETVKVTKKVTYFLCRNRRCTKTGLKSGGYCAKPAQRISAWVESGRVRGVVRSALVQTS